MICSAIERTISTNELALFAKNTLQVWHLPKIQPVEYILANGLGFCEGAVVKYVSRWKDKGGIEDLKKARHFLDLYIEHLEKK